ncbi:MAG: dihydrodipicolinate synthase family protein [Saprospiraceae bacterium]|nr:dihydrodipicolinate synthase family protein [Saprospiraceae bacterium]
MINASDLTGVIPIIPTPFLKNEEIDEASLRGLVEFAITTGLQAVCLPAYASEFYKLTDTERLLVVEIAIHQSVGRIKIIAQSNSPSLRTAIKLAQANVVAGADIISLAVPRLFSLPQASIESYLRDFLDAIPDTPVLVQDFNPGGASLSVPLIHSLSVAHANFKFLKLEEPLCAPKFAEILNTTGDRVGVFEGWGGLYMMELIPVGINGAMPGLAVSDILQKVFTLRRNGFDQQAFEIFERVMPQIFFSLQNMELFHYAEKELLVARGLLPNSFCRKAAYLPDESSGNYIRELNQRVLQLLKDIEVNY